MYIEETRGIRVIAEPRYLPEESDPDQSLYVFGYTITIANRGKETVQLLSRYWLITDATGSTREVRGEGVLGEQPILASGGSHQYSSFSPLATPLGNMRGHYRMRSLETGEEFVAKIPLFFLRNLNELTH